MEFGTPDHKALLAARAERMSKSRIRSWSHVATRVHDLEVTRHFYEDLLGLPLVTAHHASSYPEKPGEDTNYIHAFFELGDGSCIAFFQFAPGLHGAAATHSPDMYERHLAMRVDSKDDVHAIGKRLADANVEYSIIDHHGVFYSLYVNDPDGDTIEITYHGPVVDQLYLQPEPGRVLSEWLSTSADATQTA